MLRLVGGHERPRRSGDVGARAADVARASHEHEQPVVLRQSAGPLEQTHSWFCAAQRLVAPVAARVR